MVVSNSGSTRASLELVSFLLELVSFLLELDIVSSTIPLSHMCRHYRERMSRERNSRWVRVRNRGSVRESDSVRSREYPRHNYAENKDGQQHCSTRANWRD